MDNACSVIQPMFWGQTDDAYLQGVPVIQAILPAKTVRLNTNSGMVYASLKIAL